MDVSFLPIRGGILLTIRFQALWIVVLHPSFSVAMAFGFCVAAYYQSTPESQAFFQRIVRAAADDATLRQLVIDLVFGNTH